ncbi:hypothetical protein CHUAL_006231 [Chamberlinius hualienensis]
MHRSSAGGLASLTANYTDSDASDSDEHDEEEKRENSSTITTTAATTTTNTQTKAISTTTNDALTNNFQSFAADHTESTTNSVSELGHITDEDQSDTSDRGEIEDDDEDTNNNVNVNSNNINNNVARTNESMDEVEIPPEPHGWCSKQLQDKITEKYELMMREGLDSNALIQNKKQFRNPSIYEKLIEVCQIEEMGSNYSPDIYDPHQFDSSSFYEELAKAQKTEMDKRQKEQKERTKIEFISGTKKTITSVVEPKDESKKRKSKWDVAATNVVIGPQPKPIGLLTQPTAVVNIASATKATVISAFGSIAKKPKQ